MQALSSSQNSNNSINTSSTDECQQEQQSSSSEISSCEMVTSAGENNTPTSGSNHVENTIVNNQQHINNNTIAINNNNCDTTKNNNQEVTATTTTLTQHLSTTPTPIEMVNEVEAAPAIALIDQQNALLRGVNMGKFFKFKFDLVSRCGIFTKFSFSFFFCFPSFFRSFFFKFMVTIAGTLGRKRPLLCSRNINNPTKRTVLTLLARAKTANALHGFHPNGPSICE
jgi:hypothetical protein